ncbi:MAG: PAQR family membrane homeostasis protein TrhA [Acidimicrobiales bacterium]
MSADLVERPSPSTATRAASGESKPMFRGFSHLLAFSSALTLAPILIVITPGVAPRFIMAIYGLSIVGLFGVSALYHRNTWSERAIARIRRLDHSMIFVATAATHTPIALLALPRGPGWLLFAVVWTGATLGIAGRVFFPDAPYPVVAIPYVLVGWSSLFVIDDVWNELGVAAFVLLIVGGGLYTLGAVIYAAHRPNPWPNHFGYHEIFHALTIGGAACHYVVIAIFVRGLV